MFTIHLAKESFKFSCSHFTIFGEAQGERLHGHNYQLKVDISVNAIDPKLGMAFDFNVVKPLLLAFCQSLDERILLPLRSPFLKIQQPTERTEVQFGKKHYVFPAEDTLCLPLVNISSEELARYACETLVTEMKSVERWTALSVHIEETRGQSVSYHHRR